MSPSSKSLLLVLGNLVSVTMVAWSSRASYLHADLAGWGDAAADKEQYFLWWARFISVILVGAAVILSALYSSSYRWSVIGGATVTGVSWWVSGISSFKWSGFLLLPGWFAQAVVFGVHADLERVTTPLCWMIGINTVLYATAIALISAGMRGTAASMNDKLGASS